MLYEAIHFGSLQLLNYCIQNQILAMSDQDVVIVSKRKTNRLNLDSEEEARIEAEENARLEEIRQRKQEKRRRKEEEARREEEQAKKKLQQQQKYQNPQTMLLEDSNSEDSFSRVEKKIRKAYPQFRGKQESSKRRHESESQESEEESEEESSQSSPESNHKKKPQKKVKKERRAEEDEEVRQSRQKVERVKIEEEDPKERLVKEVGVRWWFCLPEWPAPNYPYKQELRKLGYRLVEQNRFRMQQNLVNGLLKATTIDGFVGVFKTKLKIIDIRPKETIPSLRFLRSKSIEQLTSLLKVALKNQIQQLSVQKYHQNEEVQLLTQLQRRLNELN